MEGIIEAGRYLIWCSFLLILFCSGSCEEDFPSSAYLTVHTSITPAKNIYQVGDTVTIESELGPKVFDRDAGDSLIVLSWKEPHITLINDVLDWPELIPFTGNFQLEYDTTTGGEVRLLPFSNYEELHVDYIEIRPGRWKAFYQLIFEREGVFMFNVAKVNEFPGQTPDGIEIVGVNSARLSQYNITNNEEENNFSALCGLNELFCEVPWTNREGWFDSNGSYVFVVEE